MYGVTRFYNLLRIGVTWKGPEVIELWYHPSDSSKESTVLHSKGDDAAQTSLMFGGGRLARPGRMNVHIDLDDGDTTTDDQSDTNDRPVSRGAIQRCGSARKARLFSQELNEEPDAEQSANESGSDEDDSLLVAYDSNSQVGSVWPVANDIAHVISFHVTVSKALTWTAVSMIGVVELYAQWVLVLNAL